MSTRNDDLDRWHGILREESSPLHFIFHRYSGGMKKGELQVIGCNPSGGRSLAEVDISVIERRMAAMGIYYERDDGGRFNKADELVSKGGKMVSRSEILDCHNRGMGIFCIVNNGAFEAAAYAFDESELRYLYQHEPSDLRGPYQWVAFEDLHAARCLVGLVG